MFERFVLDVTIVGSGCCARARRGFAGTANPFRRSVSLSWLRGAKAQRILNEVLPPTTPARTFDLLILDGAHHKVASKQVCGQHR